MNISNTGENKAYHRSLLLTVGEDKTLDLNFKIANSNAISYGNPQIVTTTLVNIGDQTQLVFKPLKAGISSVSIRDENGNLGVIFNVEVTGSNLSKTAQELKLILRDVEGLQIKLIGSKIILDGEILVPADYGRLAAVLADKEYADNVLNLTTLSIYAMSFLAKKIQSDINSFAPNITTRVVNGSIFLEGNTENLDLAKRAEKIAFYYLPDTKPANLIEKDPTAQKLPNPRSLIQNFIMIRPAPPKKDTKLVKITIHFVQLNKDYSSSFGFKWAPGFTTDGPQITLGQAQNGGAVAASSPTLSGTLTSLLPKLITGEQSGYARILRTGTLVVRSGQIAKLNETTDYPFQQLGANGQVGTSSKSVGLSLSVTPSILGNTEDISLDLDLNQSGIISEGVAGGPPRTATHKISTKIYVKANESAAIAGATLFDNHTDFNKDDPSPNSSSNTFPLLQLLHSRSYSKTKSQVVMFVTPMILESASEGSEELKQNFRIKVN